MTRIRTLLPLLVCLAYSSRLTAAESRPVFPTPFVVEHHVETTDGAGELFVSDTVTDTYGGSWLVSVHPSGLRTIVDFNRRELTEVDAAKGTYWTMTFGRMGELRQRIARAQRAEARKETGELPARAVKVEELRDSRALATSELSPGARHYRATLDGKPAMEAWLDGRVTLAPPALEALRAFETEALGDDAQRGATPGDLVHAIRSKGSGAFPVRVRRTTGARGEVTSEDMVTRLETIPAFPEKLVTIGAGFKRVPSPLEIIAAFEDEEEARRGTGR